MMYFHISYIYRIKENIDRETIKTPIADTYHTAAMCTAPLISWAIITSCHLSISLPHHSGLTAQLTIITTDLTSKHLPSPDLPSKNDINSADLSYTIPCKHAPTRSPRCMRLLFCGGGAGGRLLYGVSVHVPLLTDGGNYHLPLVPSPPRILKNNHFNYTSSVWVTQNRNCAYFNKRSTIAA